MLHGICGLPLCPSRRTPACCCRQAHELHAELINAGRDSTLRSCTGDEGADAHCQLNNLRFAHALIFDWLAKKMNAPAAVDPRMVA